MRNLVSKNDFNRGGAHKSLRDYTRVSSRELMDTCYEELEDSWKDWPDFSMEEDWGVHWEDEEDLPLKDPKEWESSNRAAYY